MDSTPTQSVRSSSALFPDDVLEACRRTVCIANGKGGVGKTTLTTNLSTVLAEAGYKTLVVDLDAQGNVAVNLGYIDDERYDDGQALARAVQFGEAPVPTTGVRENLDVLSGGEHTSRLLDILHGDALRGGKMRGGVARALAKVAQDYDLIFIDTPPSDAGYTAVEEAMLASRWILAPVRPEPKSLKGLESLARRVTNVNTLNPFVALLGVVLFGVPTGATRVEKRPREILGQSLEGIAPVFEAKIRNVVAADADATFRGESAHELAQEVKTQAPFWERLKNPGKGGPQLAASAGSLAEDYMALAEQIVAELSAQEAALEEAKA
ncbi:ParA family protein [Sinomonas sp. JGH33]|uniref:ParA family protein n=1 Tax=Sinomonas terricola TaxID=3110330 RepID=A0ABU5TC83_9MICC|nr:ParA family protein [Sinomonas sp. JGH33]MEA5457291.1 ParA family protein [Sinomonas sp. JGH33]